MTLARTIRHKIRRLITDTWYKAACRKLGRNCFIGKPLFFSPEFISMGDNVYIWANCRVEGISSYQGVSFHPSIEIHDEVSIQQNLHLTCASSVIIGRQTAIAANVSISDINHPYKDISKAPELQQLEVTPVRIGEACKIYNNAVILPGAQLGRHNVVAANTVVAAGNYPDYCVIAGNPGVVKKRYNPGTNDWEKTDNQGNFLT